MDRSSASGGRVQPQSGRRFDRWSRTNLYFATILEVDRRTEHHLVALLDAVADLDLGSEVADFGDLAAVREAVLDHEHMEAVPVEDDGPCRHDQRRGPARDFEFDRAVSPRAQLSVGVGYVNLGHQGPGRR